MPEASKNTRQKRRPEGRTPQKTARSILPPTVRMHLRASVREGLLAFESLFNEAVRALEKGTRTETRKRGKKIKVE